MNNAIKAGDIDALGQIGAPEQVATFQQDLEFHGRQRRRVGQVYGLAQRGQSATE